MGAVLARILEGNRPEREEHAECLIHARPRLARDSVDLVGGEMHEDIHDLQVYERVRVEPPEERHSEQPGVHPRVDRERGDRGWIARDEREDGGCVEHFLDVWRRRVSMT